MKERRDAWTFFFGAIHSKRAFVLSVLEIELVTEFLAEMRHGLDTHKSNCFFMLHDFTISPVLLCFNAVTGDISRDSRFRSCVNTSMVYSSTKVIWLSWTSITRPAIVTLLTATVASSWLHRVPSFSAHDRGPRSLPESIHKPVLKLLDSEQSRFPHRLAEAPAHDLSSPPSFLILKSSLSIRRCLVMCCQVHGVCGSGIVDSA